MRGKKTDPLFLSNFISECVNKGITSTDDMAKRAQTLIASIDTEIKKVEAKKAIRSKLLDVLDTFSKPDKAKRHEEARLLPFFNIRYPEICKFICDNVNSKISKIEEIVDIEYNSLNAMFCIKQLIKHKVLYRVGDSILRGPMFDDYIKFVLKE